MAFDSARRSKAGALIALDDALTYGHRTRVVALAADSRLPALYGYREFADEGGLMSYGADLASHYRHPPPTSTRFCGEQSPAKMPVEQATKVDLIINLENRKIAWPHHSAGPPRPCR